jgi:tetratricopeptide (TPR) repeat protein/prepilin signal peptidase PulO-like enzyme (type II secretory pathway)
MPDLTSPTPVASAVSSLAFLAIVALLYLAISLLRGSRTSRSKSPGAFDAIIAMLRKLDAGLVHGFSWITGTRYRWRYQRLPILLLFFLFVTAAAVYLPWPFSMVAVGFGVFSIFIVFRHWSRDEDEAIENVPFERKDIRLNGTLGAEVLIASGFLFVFAPIAFAQLQNHGLGFTLNDDAKPFAFLLYTLIETVKAGSLVDYYDLYAGGIGFEKIGAPTDPSRWAKVAIILYRVSLNLLLLAAIKRLIDVAKRRAEGADLRAVAEALRATDSEKQEAAIGTLRDFALRGRGNARDLLEKVAEPRQSEGWPIHADTRYQAASALLDYGTQRGGASALYAAADGYRALMRDGYDREADAKKWRAAAHNLGNTLVQLGQQIGDPERLREAKEIYSGILASDDEAFSPASRLNTQIVQANILADLAMMTGERADLEEAVASYRAAISAADPEADKHALSLLQSNLGATLADIAEIDGDTAIIEEAIAAYRVALEDLSPKTDPEAWSMAQNNLGNALADLGKWTGESPPLVEALLAHEQSLNIRTKASMPLLWAMSQNNLANALSRLASLENDTNRLQEAIAHYKEAQTVYQREQFPADWAWTESLLASALIDLANMSGEAKHFEAALVCCDGAASSYKAADMPSRLAWVRGLRGNAFVGLKRFEEAASCYREALSWQTFENAGDDWVLSINNLAACLYETGNVADAHSVIAEALDQLPDDPRLLATQAAMGLDAITRVPSLGEETPEGAPVAVNANQRHFRVSVQRMCGEFVIGRVSKAFYTYWKDRDDFADQVGMIDDPNNFDTESPSPYEDGGDCEGWYAIDDVAHVNNAIFNGNRIYVDEVVPDTDDYSGFRQKPDGYSEAFDIDDILNGMPEGFCQITREYAVEPDVDNPETPVFVGKSIEKGAQTDVIVSTEGNFDPGKLSFEIWNIDGDPVIASISYAGEDLEIIADSSTGKAFYAYLGGLE